MPISKHNPEHRPPTQLPIIDVLLVKNPGKNVLFTAIEQLETPGEMREFFDQYVESFADADDPLALALDNLGYVLKYFDTSVAQNWEKALLPHKVEHPYFPSR